MPAVLHDAFNGHVEGVGAVHGKNNVFRFGVKEGRRLLPHLENLFGYFHRNTVSAPAGISPVAFHRVGNRKLDGLGFGICRCRVIKINHLIPPTCENSQS